MNLKLGVLLLAASSLAWLSCAQTVEAPDDMSALEPEPELPKPGDMVLIPAGEFVMGTDEKRTGRPALESPERKVDLPAYKMDVYEVTHGQWIRFTTKGEYGPEGNWRQFYSIGKEDFPVTNVTWEDAKAFCEWAEKRLPTEAEWEKAARGAEGNKYPWGNKFDAYKSNCNEKGYGNTIEVGQMPSDKSVYEVYDLMGNAQEWTSEELKPYPKSPIRRSPEFRRGYIAVRGGSYAMKGGSMSLYTRSGFFPKSQYGIGFRCAQDVEVEEGAEEAAEEVSDASGGGR